MWHGLGTGSGQVVPANRKWRGSTPSGDLLQHIVRETRAGTQDGPDTFKLQECPDDFQAAGKDAW